MEPLFRLAKYDEIDAILAMYRSAVGLPHCSWDEEYPGRVQIDEDFRAGNLFVLLLGEQIIGAISIVPQNELNDAAQWEVKENAAEFARVVIAPAYQGKGYSSLLVDEVLKEIQNRQFHAVHLCVAVVNTPAQRTYLKKGFCILGEKELYGGRFYLCEKQLFPPSDYRTPDNGQSGLQQGKTSPLQPHHSKNTIP